MEAAKYLPDNYLLHVLGFGNKEQISEVLNKAEEISRTSQCKIEYHGQLLGEEYEEFLRKCDIGLSTQQSAGNFNVTSFPSKILSYLGNGLEVVTAKMNILERSVLNQHLHYYQNDRGQSIAQAIQEIDFSGKKGSNSIVADLDKDFKRELLFFLNR